MTKTMRALHTLEFKQAAVRLVAGGQSIAAAARSLAVVEQTMFNWVEADRQDKLNGADRKVVGAEQMETSRLRVAFPAAFQAAARVTGAAERAGDVGVDLTLTGGAGDPAAVPHGKP